MKRIVLFICVVSLITGANAQVQFWTYNPVCPSTSILSQTGTTDIAEAFHAWTKETEYRLVADNYSASSAFNSIRFWGVWGNGGYWNNATCSQSPSETFHIEIFNVDPFLHRKI